MKNPGLKITTTHYAPDCVTEIKRTERVYNGSGAAHVLMLSWLAAAFVLIGVTASRTGWFVEHVESRACAALGYTLDYAEAPSEAYCVNLDTGKTIWSHRYWSTT